jgi:hypothetical protein
MIATLVTPSGSSSRQSLASRSSDAWTKGQWLQMNMTSVPRGPRQSASVQVRPSGSARLKSGALEPVRAAGVSVLAMLCSQASAAVMDPEEAGAR